MRGAKPWSNNSWWQKRIAGRGQLDNTSGSTYCSDNDLLQQPPENVGRSQWINLRSSGQASIGEWVNGSQVSRFTQSGATDNPQEPQQVDHHVNIGEILLEIRKSI